MWCRAVSYPFPTPEYFRSITETCDVHSSLLTEAQDWDLWVSGGFFLCIVLWHEICFIVIRLSCGRKISIIENNWFPQHSSNLLSSMVFVDHPYICLLMLGILFKNVWKLCGFVAISPGTANSTFLFPSLWKHHFLERWKIFKHLHLYFGLQKSSSTAHNCSHGSFHVDF